MFQEWGVHVQTSQPAVLSVLILTKPFFFFCKWLFYTVICSSTQDCSNYQPFPIPLDSTWVFFFSPQTENIAQSIQCKRGFLTPNNRWNNEVAVVIVFVGVLRVVFYVTAVLFSLSPPASVCWGQLWLVAVLGWGGRGLVWMVSQRNVELRSFGGDHKCSTACEFDTSLPEMLDSSWL